MTDVSVRRGAWTTLSLLCCLYAVSFIDRMVLALVVDPVRASLGVSDTQISLLFGMGFVVVYVLSGFPLAHLIDKGNRKRILICGVLFWSFCTFLCGFVPSYWLLVAARSGVAIGEAVLMPVAMSMIYDLFPREKRTFPVTFYTMTGVVMASGSFVVGSLALRLAEQMQPIIALEPWRIMFAIVALPGLILAILVMLLVRDPERRREGDEVQAAGTADLVAHLRKNASIYFPVFLGTGCIFMAGLGLSAWTPTMLVREHGLAASSAGIYYGTFATIAAVFGTILMGLLVRRLGRDGGEKGVFRSALLVSSVTLPVLALAIDSADVGTVLVGVTIGMFGIKGATTLVPLLMQQITPRALMGRTTATYLMFNNLMGMGLGPIIVSALAGHYAGEPRSLGMAISTAARGAVAVALLCYAYGLAYLLRRARRASEQAPDSDLGVTIAGRG